MKHPTCTIEAGLEAKIINLARPVRFEGGPRSETDLEDRASPGIPAKENRLKANRLIALSTSFVYYYRLKNF